jgi:hypothetical protein
MKHSQPRAVDGKGEGPVTRGVACSGRTASNGRARRRDWHPGGRARFPPLNYRRTALRVSPKLLLAGRGPGWFRVFAIGSINPLKVLKYQ